MKLFLSLLCLYCFISSLQTTKSLRMMSTSRSRFSPLVNEYALSRVKSTMLKFKVADEVETAVDDNETLEFVTHEPGKKSNLLKKLSNGVIPIAASVGFAITPSSTLITRIAGAAAGGAAGLLAKRTLLDRLFKDDDEGSGGTGGGSTNYIRIEIERALKEMKLDQQTNLSSINTKSIELIAKRFKVPEADLKTLFTYIFSDTLLSTTSTNEEDFLELGNFIEFSDSIGFTEGEIGNGFTLAISKLARYLQRDSAGFYINTNTHTVDNDITLLQASKIYFLCDKLLTIQRGFYGNRIDTALSFNTPESYKKLITNITSKMFTNFINNILTKPENFNNNDMLLYNNFLTVSSHISDFRPANMQNLIKDSIQYTIDNKLKNPTITTITTTDTTPTDTSTSTYNLNFENLAKIKSIFGWNTYEFDATIETKTIPIFEKEVYNIIQSCIEDPDNASTLATKLLNLKKSLNIDNKKARAYILTLISEQNAEYMNKIQRVYEVSGESSVEPAFKIMMSYAKLWEGFKILTESVMVDEDG